MADPLIVLCPIAGTGWTKVATNVTSGIIHLFDGKDQAWYQTYVTTGGTAPTDLSKAVKFGKDSLSGETEDISFAAGADVYLKPSQKDGSVRVDL